MTGNKIGWKERRGWTYDSQAGKANDTFCFVVVYISAVLPVRYVRLHCLQDVCLTGNTYAGSGRGRRQTGDRPSRDADEQITGSNIAYQTSKCCNGALGSCAPWQRIMPI